MGPPSSYVKYDWLFPEEAACSGSAIGKARARSKVSFRIVFSLQLLISQECGGCATVWLSIPAVFSTSSPRHRGRRPNAVSPFEDKCVPERVRWLKSRT